MPLQPGELEQLEQAQAAVQQAKTEAGKAWAAANNVKPLIPEATAAAKAAFAAAAKAEEEGEDAARLAARLNERLEESIQETNKAHKKAVQVRAAAETRLESAEKQLSGLSEKLSSAKDAATTAASELKAAQVPEAMQGKLDRLKSETAALEQARDQKLQAQKKAVAEIEAAKKVFDEQTRIGEEVRCQQRLLSYYWSGPPVLEGETKAKAALEKLEGGKPAADQALSESEKALEAKSRELADQERKIRDKLKALTQAKKKAADAAGEAADLERQVQQLQADIPELQRKWKDALAREKSSSDELDRLTAVTGLGKEAAEALEAASNAHKKAIEVCDARGLTAERLDADIGSGDVFANLTDAQKRAVKTFNRGGEFGKTARRLAPALNGLSKDEFLQAMRNERSARHSFKNTKKPGGGQQQMQKWEFADGTVVRYKPAGDEYSAGQPTYSIEVKTNRREADQDLEGIGFKVDPKGRAVPKAPGNLNNPYFGQRRDDYRDGAMRQGHRPL